MSTTATVQGAPVGTFRLDRVHSTFGFAVTHLGISKFRGQFDHVEANLDDGVLTGTVRVDSVRTPVPQLKDHLLAPDFFNAAEEPTITFRSTDIRVADDGSAEVDGELTIRGVTRPVRASGDIASTQNMAGEEVVGVDLATTIDRREYGLSWQTALPNGADALGWNVTLDVHLELVREQ